jgi:hypothetical protein
LLKKKLSAGAKKFKRRQRINLIKLKKWLTERNKLIPKNNRKARKAKEASKTMTPAQLELFKKELYAK